ncbi:MAG: hypothetical protein JXQ87_13400 [Bacteroidia bacterium]
MRFCLPIILLAAVIYFESCNPTDPGERNNVVLIELIENNNSTNSHIAAIKLNSRTDQFGVYANEDVGKFVEVKIKSESDFLRNAEAITNLAKENVNYLPYFQNIDVSKIYQDLPKNVSLSIFKEGKWYLNNGNSTSYKNFEKGEVTIDNGQEKSKISALDFSSAYLEIRDPKNLYNNLNKATLEKPYIIDVGSFKEKKYRENIRLHQYYNPDWAYYNGQFYKHLSIEGWLDLTNNEATKEFERYKNYKSNNSLLHFQSRIVLLDYDFIPSRAFGGEQFGFSINYFPQCNGPDCDFADFRLTPWYESFPTITIPEATEMLSIIDAKFDGYLVQYSYTSPTYQPMAEYLPFMDANDPGGAKTWTSVKIEDENGTEITEGHADWDKWKFTLDNEYTFMKGNRFRYKLGSNRATKEKDYVDDNVNYIYGTYKDLSVEEGDYVVEFAFPNNPTAQDGADQFKNQTVKVLGEPNYTEFKIKLKESDYYDVASGEQDDEVTLTIKVKEEVRWEDFNNAN